MEAAARGSMPTGLMTAAAPRRPFHRTAICAASPSSPRESARGDLAAPSRDRFNGRGPKEDEATKTKVVDACIFLNRSGLLPGAIAPCTNRRCGPGGHCIRQSRTSAGNCPSGAPIARSISRTTRPIRDQHHRVRPAAAGARGGTTWIGTARATRCARRARARLPQPAPGVDRVDGRRGGAPSWCSGEAHMHNVRLVRSSGAKTLFCLIHPATVAAGFVRACGAGDDLRPRAHPPGVRRRGAPRADIGSRESRGRRTCGGVHPARNIWHTPDVTSWRIRFDRA